MNRQGAAEVQEKRITFAQRNVPVFVQCMCIGYELAQLQPGAVLRIHLFERTNNNGDETIASVYARETTENCVRDVIKRQGLRMSVRRDGLDLLVEMGGGR